MNPSNVESLTYEPVTHTSVGVQHVRGHLIPLVSGAWVMCMFVP
jgi:hypothetical protein